MYRVPSWLRWPRLLIVSFCLGALTDFCLSARLQREIAAQGAAAQKPASQGAAAEAPLATSGRRDALPGVADVPAERSEPPAAALSDEIAVLREKELLLPVEGAIVEQWKGSFDEPRIGHMHAAVDILAPRRTPVRAVEAGTVAKLFHSKGGGLTIYQFDPTRRFIYYYAHLDSYEPGLREGDAVVAGQVVGYVGTTGNAPPDTPHLHFAIMRVTPGEGWWQGTAVDPYEAFKR